MFYSEQSQEDCLKTCQEDDPRNVYEDDHSGSWTDGCDDKCSEELTNGLQASLVSAGLAVPVIGILNYGFGWLRRPLNADLMTKSGETLDALEEQEKEKADVNPEIKPGAQATANQMDEVTSNTPRKQTISSGGEYLSESKFDHRSEIGVIEKMESKEKHSVVHSRHGHLCGICGGAHGKACCLVRCFRNICITKPMSCAHCLAVQACCVYGVMRAILSWAKNHACCYCQSRVHPELYSPRVKELAPPRTRAQVGRRRQAVARQMETCKESATVLFQKYDENNSGYLESEQLRKLMIELNGNIAVSDHALNFVMSQATIGVDDNRISPAELAPAVSLWRYLQHEQAFIEQRFDDFDSSNNHQLEIEELKEFLTSLNDDIPVTDKEARWVLSQTDKDKSGGLDKMELRAAVALWYPTVYNRRKVQLAHVVFFTKHVHTFWIQKLC